MEKSLNIRERSPRFVPLAYFLRKRVIDADARNGEKRREKQEKEEEE